MKTLFKLNIITWVTFLGVNLSSAQTPLTVDGALHVWGNDLTFGTAPISGSVDQPGLTTQYTDVQSSSSGTLTQFMSRPYAAWRWEHNIIAGSGINPLAMQLDANHQLTLNATTGTSQLVLSPNLGTYSSIPSSITISGTDNRLPYQSLTSSASILTRLLADGLYISKTTLGGGTGSSATGTGAVALGNYAVANSGTTTSSVALGRNTVANSGNGGVDGSVAIGSNVTSGGNNRTKSVVIGYGSWALGSSSVALGMDAFTGDVAPGSFAVGWQTRVYSEGGVAIGRNVTSGGKFAIGLGNGISTNGYRQIVLGNFNSSNPADNPNASSPTQNLFVLGNGTDGAPSNALTVKWNGDTSINGGLNVSNSVSASGATVSGAVNVGSLDASTGRFSGKVRLLTPKGGISMGEFIFDPEASAP